MQFVAYAGPDIIHAFFASVPVGSWLASYDPDANDGLGEITWTKDPAHAMTFANAAAALACYRTASVVHPFRDDGEPNRPLTFCTVAVTKLPGHGT